MEAQPRRHVEVEIRMVHAMQAPQRRHGVEQHVLEVDGEVEQDHRHQHRHWLRQVHPGQQAKALSLHRQGDADRRGREEKADDQRVKGDYAKVARPAPQPSEGACPARQACFQPRHHGQHAGEDAEADQGLVGEQGIHAARPAA
ncbi:hypothetical protein ACLF3G_24795 [Falsiroseomonas sp. HC035]|uniref:hypothetical protein n=1 Tax=Falsiroseomonas sp. HC035 TaxID=3390999 RepID=UPI003D3224EB